MRTMDPLELSADGDMGHIVVKELGDRVLTHIFQGQKRGRQLRLQW